MATDTVLYATMRHDQVYVPTEPRSSFGAAWSPRSRRSALIELHRPLVISRHRRLSTSVRFARGKRYIRHGRQSGSPPTGSGGLKSAAEFRWPTRLESQSSSPRSSRPPVSRLPAAIGIALLRAIRVSGAFFGRRLGGRVRRRELRSRAPDTRAAAWRNQLGVAIRQEGMRLALDFGNWNPEADHARGGFTVSPRRLSTVSNDTTPVTTAKDRQAVTSCDRRPCS